MSTVAHRRVSLRTLMKGIAPAPEIMIDDLALDSRLVAQGSLFIAYPGASDDGRDHIPGAVARGAVAVIYDPQDYSPCAAEVPMIPLQDARQWVGSIADRFFGSPSKVLKVIGITGTNGKTTCCYLLAQALIANGGRAAMIGTLGLGSIAGPEPGLNTTPDAISMQRALADMAGQGVDYVCVEVSSHALDQGRVHGVEFYATVFTNLSRDHLDYHRDMETYAAAKKLLFTDFGGPIGVVNIDDERGRDILDDSNRASNWSYGEGGDVSAADVKLVPDGILLTLVEQGQSGAGKTTKPGTYTVACNLIGRINVPNLVAVVTALRAMGVGWKAIESLTPGLRPAPGRMELIAAPATAPSVVVDYAHTPDALRLALSSLREYCSGALWCVFGCGGDRDREKRSLMGAVAETASDRVVVTDDNPRSESPEQIVSDILSGMTSTPDVLHERSTAIQWAISQAAEDDWVLVAGKGHESEQIVGKLGRPFSDRHWVRECLGVAA